MMQINTGTRTKKQNKTSTAISHTLIGKNVLLVILSWHLFLLSLVLITNALKLNKKLGSILCGISPQSIFKPQPFPCLAKSLVLHDSSIFSWDKTPKCSSSVSSPAPSQPRDLVCLPWSAYGRDRQESP